jgi:hypothetical protein
LNQRQVCIEFKLTYREQGRETYARKKNVTVMNMWHPWRLGLVIMNGYEREHCVKRKQSLEGSVLAFLRREETKHFRSKRMNVMMNDVGYE